MVDKSTTLSKPTLGWMFVIGQSRPAFSSKSEAPIQVPLHAPALLPRDMTLHPDLALVALKRKPLARGTRALRAPSIVGWFCQLPWRASAIDSVAPDGSP